MTEAKENITRPGTGLSSGPGSLAEGKVSETGSSDLAPIQTGTDAPSTGRNQKKEPKQLTGNRHQPAVQPWSSTTRFQAFPKSDASLLENDESPESPAARGVTSAEGGAASTDVSLLDGLQNSGFGQRTSPVMTAVTESGFLTSSTYPSPEGGIKDEEVEVSPLAVTSQLSAETHTTFSEQVQKSLAPSKASIKASEVPPKHLNKGINEAEEDLGHISVRRIKDKEEMDIAVDRVTLETETSSPHPLPGGQGEEDNRAGTDTDDLTLEEQDVDVNVWTTKGPEEKDVSTQSSLDWSPRPPTADPVIHSKTVKATNQAPPRTAQPTSKLGPGVRGQRVRPCLHIACFVLQTLLITVLTIKGAAVRTSQFSICHADVQVSHVRNVPSVLLRPNFLYTPSVAALSLIVTSELLQASAVCRLLSSDTRAVAHPLSGISKINPTATCPSNCCHLFNLIKLQTIKQKKSCVVELQDADTL